ncbi:MAG TPA: methyltransferase domain-containing protein [Ohtaekwangia sp.]
MKANKEIKRDEGAAKIFDDRSLEVDYRTLVPVLRPGLRVLDVGCGTGAISKGMASYVGPTGYVTGIDNTEKFILSGKETYNDVPNLELLHTDLFSFEPEEKFDMITAARVLQWLNNPLEALLKMKSMLKPGGQISILDYNHEAIEWRPAPPLSMQKFYNTFLKWRSDAGMNNRIADELAAYFSQAGLHTIEVIEANEVYHRGENSRLAIWTKVAGLKQIVEEGYIKEEERLLAIEDYNRWIEQDAEQMTLRLNEVRGRL